MPSENRLPHMFSIKSWQPQRRKQIWKRGVVALCSTHPKYSSVYIVFCVHVCRTELRLPLGTSFPFLISVNSVYDVPHKKACTKEGQSNNVQMPCLILES